MMNSSGGPTQIMDGARETISMAQRSEAPLRQREGEDSGAGGHDDHLLSFDAERHGVAGHGAAEVDPPEFFAGLSVEREEIAFHCHLLAADPASGATEDEFAGSGKDAGPGLGVHLMLPDSVAGFGIQGTDGAPAR